MRQTDYRPTYRLAANVNTQELARLTIYTLYTLILLVVLSLTTVSTARAQSFKYSFTDPVGDQTGAVDVTNMVLFFDLEGNYELYLTADSARPFVDDFRVNINLFNPDVAPEFSSFSHHCTKKCDVDRGGNTDFDLFIPTTKLPVLEGRDLILTHWAAGNRVVTSSFAGLGNPPGTPLFRSAVGSFPLTFRTNEDCIACDTTGVVIGEASISAHRGW